MQGKRKKASDGDVFCDEYILKRKDSIHSEEAKKMQECTYHALGNMEREMRSLFTEEEFEQFLDYMNRIDKKAIELYCDKEANS